MKTEKQSSVRALTMRLTKVQHDNERLRTANENLLRRLDEMMEAFRQDMGFTDSPTKDGK